MKTTPDKNGNIDALADIYGAFCDAQERAAWGMMQARAMITKAGYSEHEVHAKAAAARNAQPDGPGVIVFAWTKRVAPVADYSLCTSEEPSPPAPASESLATASAGGAAVP